MLVLSRRKGESIVIDGDIRITLLSSGSGQVRLGIEAPRHIPVHRQEVFDQLQAEPPHGSVADSLGQEFEEALPWESDELVAN